MSKLPGTKSKTRLQVGILGISWEEKLYLRSFTCHSVPGSHKEFSAWLESVAEPHQPGVSS
jgi:hypothetical protein